MDELFYWLLNMSVAASVTGAAVLVMRAIRRIPRRVVTVLWIIPAIRAWIPFGVGSRYSLMTLLSQLTTKTVTAVRPIDDVDLSLMNSLGWASDYFPITYKVNVLADVFRVAAVVWAIGAAAVAVALFIVYLTTVSELSDAEPLSPGVYCSPKVVSPAVYGIFRPRIVIPPSSKDSESLDLVLLHERRHVRRLDNLKRLFAFLTAALHWFNPLSWIFLKLYLSDLEVACDESVLAKLPEEKRAGYAHALIDAEEQKTVFVASSFGGARLKTRIGRIVSFKKMTVLSAVLFGVLAAVVAFVLLTNAV